jgi:hypothetical protein
MTTALAQRSGANLGQSDWQVMREQAAALVPTGFLPSAIKTPEQAIAIMMKGRELGIPPMYALSNIAVIQGKPAANAELMLALIYRDHGDDAIQFVEASSSRAVISYKRRHWRERQTFAFTAEDAKQAGLTGDNWRKYPGAMLRARCISAVARLAFPDTIGGMYTPDELGAEVDAETGEMVPGEHTAPISQAPAVFVPPPAEAPQQPRPTKRAKLLDRYAALVEEAKTLEVPFYELTDDADEETITRLGLELKESIAEARAEDAR